MDGEGHTYAGMGVDFADYNNDGLPDLVVTDLASQMYALYRNNGDGTFTYDSYPSGIGRMTMKHSGWGVRFMDYDNDGWKDLLINQGHDLDTVQTDFSGPSLQGAHAAGKKYRQRFRGCFGRSRRDFSKGLGGTRHGDRRHR